MTLESRMIRKFNHRNESETPMANYCCSECDMEVTGITCGRCGSELEYKELTKDDGSTVNVSECPKGCGRIKSPMCCGHDMVATG